jgi:hypothetical protein
MNVPINRDDCRTCGHFWEDHGHCGRRCCVHMDFDNFTLDCDCKEFIPSDNLEFLEWRYGQLDFKFSRKSNEDLPTK